MFRIIFCLFMTSIFTACGTTRKNWADQNCHERGGYLLGKKDGRAGRNYNHAVLQKCPDEVRAVTEKGYAQGFREAGGKETTEGHQYGDDLVKDVVEAVSGGKSKKKTEESKKP